MLLLAEFYQKYLAVLAVVSINSTLFFKVYKGIQLQAKSNI